MYIYYCSGIHVLNSTCPVTNTSQVEDEHRAIDIAFRLYIAILLCIVGVLGNTVSVVVLRKDPMRMKALTMLQGLAVADTGYLMVAFFRYPLQYMISSESFALMQPIVFPLLKSFQTITMWMVVAVTFDRYMHVCWPLYAQGFFTFSRRNSITIAIFIGSFLYNLPYFFASCIMRLRDNCSRHTYMSMVYRTSFNNDGYIYLYLNLCHFIFLYALPLAALFVMNTRLIKSIRYSMRFSRHSTTNSDRDYGSSSSSSSSGGDTNATIVLIILVLVFVVCQTPELVAKVIILIDRYEGSALLNTRHFHRFHVISESLMLVNSAINFFIYAMFGRRFRYIMKETFRHLAYTNATLITHETAPLQNLHHNNGQRFA